nr:TraM recognition domain-containing protein [Thermostaphylospora chromogena]
MAAWASYAAGSGIRLSIYTQAWGQIVARWGTHAADTLWQTATCKVLMSGCSEDALLRRVSTLCGRTSVVTGHVERHDGRRRPVRELVDVMPPDAVRRLPAGYALVILDNARPTIVRTERVWKRADHRAWRRSGPPLLLPPRTPVGRPLRAAQPVNAIESQNGEVGEFTPQPANGEMREWRPPYGIPSDELAERRARRAAQAASSGIPSTPDPAGAADTAPPPGSTGRAWDLPAE